MHEPPTFGRIRSSGARDWREPESAWFDSTSEDAVGSTLFPFRSDVRSGGSLSGAIRLRPVTSASGSPASNSRWAAFDKSVLFSKATS
jgi:hypothetical protein